jgi:hypothetical protein
MTMPRWKFGEELERVESNVDYGGLVGFLVRLSVQRDDGGTEWVSLTLMRPTFWQGSCVKPRN